MKIITTLGEISDKGNWEEFCEAKGYDYYCMRGRASSNDTVELTLEEAEQFGLINNL